jgi:uncharacterized protein YqeY
MISEQLPADLKQAMLNRDSITVSVLRMLQSELKNASIAKMGEASTDDDAINVVRKEIKKRTEAAEAYHKAGNVERATAEEEESIILKAYLPAAADEEAVRVFLKEFSATLGTLEPRHRGDLIRAAKEKFGNALDGSTAARLAGELF